MNPAFSILVFTTLAGTAQGLVVVLAVAALAGLALPAGFVAAALAVAVALAVVALGASFFHLGQPRRAWRAVAMWRTSWMSREVLVLPAFIGWTALWALAAAGGLAGGTRGALLAAGAIVLAGALWLCTAMIYACLRFVQEWAHPLTLLNYTLIGLSSGSVLAGALAVAAGQGGFAASLAPWALAATLAAWGGRSLALWRNAGLRPRSTAQSATGLRQPHLVQVAMGMTGGAFNTREFFHAATPGGVRRLRATLHLAGFALPALALLAAAGGGSALGWWLAVPVQTLGLLAERWIFFAEARHPQNLYYQTAS